MTQELWQALVKWQASGKRRSVRIEIEENYNYHNATRIFIYDGVAGTGRSIKNIEDLNVDLTALRRQELEQELANLPLAA